MSNKKELKKFCKLSRYLEQVDPDLFNVFEDLCLTNYLRPMRGSSGITFLYPKDKAYRQKIINATYSNDPTVAMDMVKSLILQEYYPSPSTFGNVIVNSLKQKVAVTETTDKHVKLENGLELQVDEKFKPMGYRDNMIVYTLTGKGEISITGPAADAVEKRPAKTGGNSGKTKELQDFLKDTYVKEFGKDDNIYVKKVAIQLFVLSRNSEALKGDKKITDYLGNDEFSDSYLLDIFCATEFPQCLDMVLSALKNDEKAGSATRAKYVEYKKAIIDGTSMLGGSAPANRTSEIRSPMDIRKRIKELYNNDEQRMGKDLFIVFCNVCRDLWNTESSQEDKVKSFENFAYIASNVYGSCCTDILKQDFDIARDLTLYGNLLKSDVCLYTPRAEFGASSVSEMPSPLDLSIFSLCAFINKPVAKTGGSSYTNLLEGF